MYCERIYHTFDAPFSASQIGHKTEINRPIRQGEKRRPAPHRAMDAVLPVQRRSQRIQPG